MAEGMPNCQRVVTMAITRNVIAGLGNPSLQLTKIKRHSGALQRARATRVERPHPGDLPPSLRGALATKQSIVRRTRLWIASLTGRRGACHRARIRATRWRRAGGSQ